MPTLRDQARRLERLEAKRPGGICLAWLEDTPPRYLVDGQPVDVATFDQARTQARLCILVRYTDEASHVDVS